MEEERLLVRCHDCDNEIPDGEAYEVDGELYCENCVNVCNQCGETITNDGAIEVGDNFYCSDNCANRAGYYLCEDCNEYTHEDFLRYVEHHGSVCESCFDDNYSECPGCDGSFSREDMYHHDNEGEYYCGDCHSREENKLIQDYGYKPTPIFNKMAWENTLYLGIELEVELPDGKSVDNAVARLDAWLNDNSYSDYIYFKEDGSLNNGVEIVFHPFTLQALHKNFNLKKFCEKLSSLGFQGYESGRCGLHVHISKRGIADYIEKYNGTGYDNGSLHKGKYFFWKHSNVLANFSLRKNFRYCNFDYMEEPVHSHNTEYGRYSAFNTSASRTTAEIRIFRSTTNYKRILACLQFCDAFGNYIREVSLRELKRSKFSDFISFCRRENRYNHFVKHITRKGEI